MDYKGKAKAMGENMPSKTKGLGPLPSSDIKPMGDNLPSKDKGGHNMKSVSRANTMGESFKK